jgi:hypothetical protein
MSLSLEYIAGYIDADGTIVVVKNQQRRYYGKVCVYSQNLTVLENIKAVIAGKISMNSGVYHLQLSPNAAVKALKQLIPFLQVKREQALLVLELHRHIDQHRRRPHAGKVGGSFLSAEVVEFREMLYLRNKDLNKFDSLAFRTNRVNSVKTQEWAIPSQAEGGEVDSSEGVTTSHLTPKNNGDQECPGRATKVAKVRDSLANTILM